MKSILPILIDCQYVQPQYAGAYLLVHRTEKGEQAIFIENNTSHSVPILLAELKRQGLTPDQVQYVIITHVHLDHAGGSSALMKACPNATLLAHPNAAPHVIDPTKLVRSARKVYGDEVFDRLYGLIEPIPAARVRVMQDEEELVLGAPGRKLRFFYTRGHAKHHFCIFDSASEGVFTGDSFGLAYPLLQRNGLFIFPSTSPTDFDPTEARISVRKIVESGARSAFLTHMGEVTQLQEASDQLLKHLDAHEALLEEAIRKDIPDEALSDYCEKKLTVHFQQALVSHGMASDSAAWETIAPDLKLNAAGIAYVAGKRRRG